MSRAKGAESASHGEESCKCEKCVDLCSVYLLNMEEGSLYKGSSSVVVLRIRICECGRSVGCKSPVSVWLPVG
jgi:hypothetical protein